MATSAAQTLADRWRREAGQQRFRHASTVTPLTLPAHTSLLTGTFPAWHGVRDNGGFYVSDEQTTLAEVLKASGYRTGAFVSAFVLDARWGIAQGFDRYFDDFDLSKYEGRGLDAVQRPGADVVDQAVAWLDEDRDRPFFAWVHLYDPHTPYDAPEPFRSRFPRTMVGAYDAEIASADNAGRPAAGSARGFQPSRVDARRHRRRPRRIARRARGADARVLHLRRQRFEFRS